MDLNFTRRKFLGGAAAAGAAALIPSSARVGQRGAHTAATGAAGDTANRLLTGSTVEKVAWKAKPFSMTEV
ncbi:MAG TPA: twin-arginine translocation signal domain-containing protein, partial [Acidobacteriaceae bacterium]|nr:twin-arginine translocation signal domain-containing protein [Acidobacteriaceae bacterium]